MGGFLASLLVDHPRRRFLFKKVGGKGLGLCRRAHRFTLLIENQAVQVGHLGAGEDDFFVGKQIDCAGILRRQDRRDHGVLEAALGVLLVQRLDQDLTRIEVDDRPAFVVLCVLHIFLLFGEFDLLFPPGLSDVHPEGGENGLKVFLCGAQIPEQRFRVARVLVKTLLGDLCWGFPFGEIDDGLAGPALCDLLCGGEDPVGCLTACCGEGKCGDQQCGERG